MRTPREPWPGYADQTEAERDDLLQKKFQQAKDQNDQDYALALSAAVRNYELVLELQPDTNQSDALATHASDLHDDAGSWMSS
ncbi:MAG TPA: hypothetical protein VFG79_25645 [Solirubrobacter sp.]|jgi:hypothetical protein|nr:hypothetical protein [Solirubrobacter sp.]